MEDILKEKICFVCKNFNSERCEKKIVETQSNSTLKTIICLSYVKDANKIKPYEKPLIVTAKKVCINNFET